MKVSLPPILNNRKIVGAALALASLLIMGLLGHWLIGAELAVLFFAAGFLSRSFLAHLFWLAGCILLSCCYPSWMAGGRLSILDDDVLLLNIACSAAVYGLFMLILGRIRPAVIAASGALLLLCVINYFVYDFRGSELQWADILSIRTALNVASGYTFHPPVRVTWCVLLWGWTIFAAGLLPKEGIPVRPLLLRVFGVSAAIFCAFCLYRYAPHITPRTWARDGSLYNGYLLNFAVGMRDNIIRKPQNYESLIDQLEEAYPAGEVTLPEELPNIIVIMDESLADVRVMGDLETNQPVTPFLDSLTENTIRGYALASVFGGSTANSEFEFLTGSSMAFLPASSIAYQQYVKRTTYSLPWLLQSYGYETLATHPFSARSWNRPSAYAMLGFQDTTFVDAYPNENLIRGFVSDQEMFQYILDRLDQQGDTPLFLFGISMQNHGGYEDESYQNSISLQDGSFPKAEQYLSLIHETDKAVEQLLTHLENSPRKTVVLIFGDHLPRLEEEFFQSLHGSFDELSDKMLKYQVPFYIWANYDIPEETTPVTSLNYLGVRLLEAAGLPLPPYYQFLSDAQAVIPAINIEGFYSPDGQALTKREADKTQRQWMLLYEAAQYNNLFEKKGRSQVLFP